MFPLLSRAPTTYLAEKPFKPVRCKPGGGECMEGMQSRSFPVDSPKETIFTNPCGSTILYNKYLQFKFEIAFYSRTP